MWLTQGQDRARRPLLSCHPTSGVSTAGPGENGASAPGRSGEAAGGGGGLGASAAAWSTLEAEGDTFVCPKGPCEGHEIESRGRGRSSQAGEALLPSLPVCPQQDLRGPFPAPTESEDPWGVNARACSQGPRPRHTWVPMSPEARASGFLLCWSQHLRGHVSAQLSRWVAVSCWPVQKDIQCHLTPLLCPKAYIALPEFFSLILSLSGDKGPHLGGSPPVLHACLWLRMAHTGLRHPARCRPQ